MKLNHLVDQSKPGRIIRTFGDAQLLRSPDGKHELIGGSAADHIAATEWVSMFAHEIVLSRPGSKLEASHRAKSPYPAIRFRALPISAKNVEAVDNTEVTAMHL